MSDSASEKSKCFVVMPFGVKRFHQDGSEKSYDFDKVYKVILRRAIHQAGMEPVRADESKSSGIIHTEMFKELRDRDVVLVDLSLDNPNVYYELGIRHVMSDRGTVLLCRRGSALPFDVGLSRVIFYDYDGRSLDWEEAERVVAEVQEALQQARRGEPDSPVHALLPYVLPEGRQQEPVFAAGLSASSPSDDHVRYQEEMARLWKKLGEKPSDLYKKHKSSVFGLRSVAYACLHEKPLPKITARVARDLADAEQYSLANDCFARLKQAGQLEYSDLLLYATSSSEADPTVEGAERALALVQEAIEMIESEHAGAGTEDLAAVPELAHCYRRLAGLRQWKWQLTGDPAELEGAIETFRTALRYMEQARSRGELGYVGALAQVRLKKMILLRQRDGDLAPADPEGDRDQILALQPGPQDGGVDVSYLCWYQAIALADAGSEDAALRKALTTFAEDAAKMSKHMEIGRRQYTSLRRFLQQYSDVLRNQQLMGRISQVLQARRSAAG